jgi:hypothetical protein
VTSSRLLANHLVGTKLMPEMTWSTFPAGFLTMPTVELQWVEWFWGAFAISHKRKEGLNSFVSDCAVHL